MLHVGWAEGLCGVDWVTQVHFSSVDPSEVVRSTNYYIHVHVHVVHIYMYIPAYIKLHSTAPGMLIAYISNYVPTCDYATGISRGY